MSHIHEGERKRLVEQIKPMLNTLLAIVDNIQDNTILSEMIDKLSSINVAQRSFRNDPDHTFFYFQEGSPALLYFSRIPMPGLPFMAQFPGYDIKELEDRFRHLLHPNGWYEVNDEIADFINDMKVRFERGDFGSSSTGPLGAYGGPLSEN